MADVIIDLTNYKDRSGARVQPGTYRVVVEDAELDKSKAGNDMINTWYRIQGGEFDGQTLIDRLTLTENAMFRVVGFMQAIGLPTPKKKLKLNLQHFIGKTLDVEVDDGDPYNGRVRSEIRGYMRATGASASSETTDLEDLDVSDPAEEAEASAPAAEAPKAATQAEETKPATLSAEDVETVDLAEIDLG